MSKTQRSRKTKIGTEVAHVTRDSDTAFKVKRSNTKLQGRGHIVAASHTACYISCDVVYGVCRVNEKYFVLVNLSSVHPLLLGVKFNLITCYSYYLPCLQFFKFVAYDVVRIIKIHTHTQSV